MTKTGLLLVAALLVPAAAPAGQSPAQDVSVALVPTNHPRVPADLSQLWMAPDRSHVHTAAMNEFSKGVKLEVDADFAAALPIFSKPELQQGPLGLYAQYYQGLAQLRVGRAADARETFRAIQARQPVGYLTEAAALREAECDEALGDPRAAMDIYTRLASTKTTAPDDVLMRLGRAAKAAGDLDAAMNAFSRVYFEFPFSDLSALASDELDRLPNVPPIAPESTRYKLELGRAERLFGGKKYAQARSEFESIRRAAQDSGADDRELVNLRIAECDYFLKRPRAARDGVKPYIDKASRQGEALFFYAVSSRELGDESDYLRTVRRIADEFPNQSWAEEALNNLATHYILQNQDDQADAVFREMYEKFPTGRYAERAAWKIGWAAYKIGKYAETTRIFETAAARFPRSDYRPSWLYWSARAHDALKESSLAEARYTLVATDYLNSYYGRLAVTHLAATPQRRLVVDTQSATDGAADNAPMAAPPPPNAAIVRSLLGLELYDQAIDELHYAQKAWGDSSVIQATLGWIYHERGDLRAGINAMKRAYPQYLAAGGERLPTVLLKVLFPVNYWPLIKRYSLAHNLDPYMMAALIAQESTFTADVKSAANAYGLMQLLPSTGRQYARTELKTRRFSISLLTTAEPNLKMGTAYFADLVKQFGGAHFALATYNAGPNRVARWIAERPGIARDEFIDDIPFPETQNYVRKILGTAEDYRRLYGGDDARAGDDEDATPAVSHRATPPPAKKASAKAPAPAKNKTPAAKPRTSTSKRSSAKKKKVG
jgi:soluble lytic murein transglycosylase